MDRTLKAFEMLVANWAQKVMIRVKDEEVLQHDITSIAFIKKLFIHPKNIRKEKASPSNIFLETDFIFKRDISLIENLEMTSVDLVWFILGWWLSVVWSIS